MIIGWIIAGACVVASLLIVAHHLYRFSFVPDTARKRFYTGVILMSPVRPLAQPRARSPAPCSPRGGT